MFGIQSKSLIAPFCDHKPALQPLNEVRVFLNQLNDKNWWFLTKNNEHHQKIFSRSSLIQIISNNFTLVWMAKSMLETNFGSWWQIWPSCHQHSLSQKTHVPISGFCHQYDCGKRTCLTSGEVKYSDSWIFELVKLNWIWRTNNRA